MKPELIFFAVFAIALASGCTSENNNQNQDNLQLYKGIPTATIPSNCIEQRNNICGLFKCMINNCWCDSAQASSAVLKEGNSTVNSEQQAIAAMQSFVQSNGSEYSDVKRAVKLNNIFWNVFAYNQTGDEKVFTVAIDGTIIATVCGV